MTKEELYRRLVDISDVDDFLLELKPTNSKCYWGRYFPSRKLIRLYALDEVGNMYPEEVLIREGLHELAHHIQHHHVPYWTRKAGVMHDSEFILLYRNMLTLAFPKRDIEEVLAMGKEMQLY